MIGRNLTYMSELTNLIFNGFFDRTEFRPDCCGSHSGRGGCACLNKEQIEFLIHVEEIELLENFRFIFFILISNVKNMK